MTIESATYIGGLDSTKPAATDPKAEGDDHIRILKSAIKATFPNITAAVTPTHLELNYVAGVTSGVQTQFSGVQTQFTGVATSLGLKAPLASPTFTGTVSLPATTSLGSVTAAELAFLSGVTSAIQTQINNKPSAISPALSGTPTAPTAAPGTNTTQIASTAFVQAQAMSAALPLQTGNLGKFLQTNGSAATWAAAAAGSVVSEFTTSGTWTKPVGKSFHLVEIWGAGGGGASGDRGATATQRDPGFGGGSAISFLSNVFVDAELSATETVVVGAGGLGGAAVTVNNSVGNPGTAGGNSFFGGGKSGSDGGFAGASYTGQPNSRGSAIYIDNTISTPVTGTTKGIGIGGAAGTVGSRPGAAGTGRAGGGGGYAGDTAGTVAGGNGGAGSISAGGGGGGASTNGANSGGGGNGGNGLVRIYSW